MCNRLIVCLLVVLLYYVLGCSLCYLAGSKVLLSFNESKASKDLDSDFRPRHLKLIFTLVYESVVS
jgi:hypothetical protein